MSYRLGLTGSIGMGKTTTAAIIARHGIPVWDADKATHRLYAKGGKAVGPIGHLFPSAIVNEAVDRSILRHLLTKNPESFVRLQNSVHPLIEADRAAFLAENTAPIVLLDIPLLYEVAADKICDGVIVVTASPKVQQDRVLARGTISEAEFLTILARQMPDSEKKRRATWVIETTSIPHVEAAVVEILSEIKGREKHA